jgi:putative transposase
MSATLEDVARKKPEPSAEQLAAEELVRRAREQGLSLTGPDGLLKQLTKVMIETALGQELTEHLGHEKDGQVGNEAGNVRNGTRPKTVLAESAGEVGIEVPRDRAGTFGPQIVRKRQRRLSGVDEIVLSLYAKGLTTGEISAHFAEIYGASVSKETVSRITDRVIEEATGIDFDPHWCRHTYATRLLRKNTPIEVVSKLLGHSSIATTSDIYGHLSAEDARRALEAAGWFTGQEVQL